MKLREALIDVQKIKQGDKALVPLGSSIFLEGNLGDTSKVVMGVGAGVCVKKDTQEAVKMVEAQIEELNNLEGQLTKQMSAMMGYARNLQKEIQGMLKK